MLFGRMYSPLKPLTAFLNANRWLNSLNNKFKNKYRYLLRVKSIRRSGSVGKIIDFLCI